MSQSYYIENNCYLIMAFIIIVTLLGPGRASKRNGGNSEFWDGLEELWVLAKSGYSL